jgi:enamine deaminase RidA (YjgF/YER057c/UK114 family)
MTTRLPGAYKTRCRAVVHNGTVSCFAVAHDKTPSLYEQSRQALADLDRTLREAGSDKSRILTAMVYIADMARKDELNRAWDEWADVKNPPMRACIGGITLTGDSLIEIVATAAV